MNGEPRPNGAKIPASREAGGGLTLEFGDRVFEVSPTQGFTIGRSGDLAFPENRYLHRHFLRLQYEHDFWWLVNVGERISPTVSDSQTGTQCWLAPGARLPVIFGQTLVVFSAGSDTYQLVLRSDAPVWRDSAIGATVSGETTVGGITFTKSQKQLIVALAESALKRGHTGVSHIPSSAEAAQRLRWTVTRFNRKLDNVCDKLDRFGVEGLRGGPDVHATNRRARLVEYAVATGLVQAYDLYLLQEDQLDSGADPADGADLPASASAPDQRDWDAEEAGPRAAPVAVQPVLVQRFQARLAAQEAQQARLRQAQARAARAAAARGSAASAASATGSASRLSGAGARGSAASAASATGSASRLPGAGARGSAASAASATGSASRLPGAGARGSAARAGAPPVGTADQPNRGRTQARPSPRRAGPAVGRDGESAK
ncbi:MAG: hypothetical protein LBE08_05010 [Bifidobacteriaceae bacterium]|jgi:hypothetical protein|nr:hypothetical protein [Bifidobacteriaceae bacterium]